MTSSDYDPALNLGPPFVDGRVDAHLLTRLDRAVEQVPAARRHLAAVWMWGVPDVIYGEEALSVRGRVWVPEPGERPGEFAARVSGGSLAPRHLDPYQAVDWDTRGTVTLGRGTRVMWGVGVLVSGPFDRRQARDLIDDLVSVSDDLVAGSRYLARRCGDTWLVTMVENVHG